MKTSIKQIAAIARREGSRLCWLWAIAFTAAVFFFPVSAKGQTAPTPPSILVLYDNSGEFAWLGKMYSLKLQNLLGHFDAKVTLKPLGQYVAGDLALHNAGFYIGSTWTETALPARIKTDLDANTRPFVWMGVNLWRYAWNMQTYAPDPQFTQRYGFQLLNYSDERHPVVVYKNTELQKEFWDPGLSRIQVVDPAKVKIHATCLDAAGTPWPYILQSGNFWFVADTPMVSTTFENRSLAFADLLHDMLGIFHAESHRAYFRVEDISRGGTDPVDLRAVRQTLTSLQVPFLVSVIPEYRDWSGFYNNGVPESYRLTAASEIGQEIKLLVQAGGKILQHGTTHQLDGLFNPYTGVSGDDYEFYRITANASGAISYVGPAPGDSTSWARNRVIRGQNILKNAGFTPVGWLTPHYIASAVDYKVFAGLYPFACDRAIFFVTDSTGKIRPDELNSPFIYRDTYGLKRIPETIGYIDPEGFSSAEGFPTLPADLVRRAKALLVVRDGWAGFYFHSYLNPDYLAQTVNGIRGLGYVFVPVDGNTK